MKPSRHTLLRYVVLLIAWVSANELAAPAFGAIDDVIVAEIDVQKVAHDDGFAYGLSEKMLNRSVRP